MSRRVIGVARFSDRALPDQLQRHGIETIAADLLDRDAIANLPDAPNVVFMTGMKFGTTGQASMTWAVNVYLPGTLCERAPAAMVTGSTWLSSRV